MAKKAGNFLHPDVHGAGARSGPPRSVNCSRLMPGPGRAELQLSARGPPVPQEKGVTDVALLRHDERDESEEVGGKWAPGSGGPRGPQLDGADGKGRGSLREKNITVSSFLLSNLLRCFRNMPDKGWSGLRATKPSPGPY